MQHIAGPRSLPGVRIYTRTGDGGETGLQGGSRVPKSDPRIAAYGAVDEANSAVGLAVSACADPGIRGILEGVQSDLFVVGADLSNPDAGDRRNRAAPGMAGRLEEAIDSLEGGLPPLSSFILPGGCAAAAHLHHARAVARRAEALVVGLGTAPECARYLNRLSDLLFVAGRAANRAAGAPETEWRPGAEK